LWSSRHANVPTCLTRRFHRSEESFRRPSDEIGSHFRQHTKGFDQSFRGRQLAAAGLDKLERGPGTSPARQYYCSQVRRCQHKRLCARSRLDSVVAFDLLDELKCTRSGIYRDQLACPPSKRHMSQSLSGILLRTSSINTTSTIYSNKRIATTARTLSAERCLRSMIADDPSTNSRH
jgi:hypothetical protein